MSIDNPPQPGQPPPPGQPRQPGPTPALAEPSWGYDVPTGRITDPMGTVIGTGYSGRGKGLNNPLMDDVVGIGPIPPGKWLISDPFTDPVDGILTMSLLPAPGTDDLGRKGLRIHGDNRFANHTASRGCIVAVHSIRQAIASSEIKTIIST